VIRSRPSRRSDQRSRLARFDPILATRERNGRGTAAERGDDRLITAAADRGSAARAVCASSDRGTIKAPCLIRCYAPIACASNKAVARTLEIIQSRLLGPRRRRRKNCRKVARVPRARRESAREREEEEAMSGKSSIVRSRVIAGPSPQRIYHFMLAIVRGADEHVDGGGAQADSVHVEHSRARHCEDGMANGERDLATSPRPDFPARCTLKYSTALRRKLCRRCSVRREEASRRTRASKLPFETTARSRLQSESDASPQRHERNRASLREAAKLGAGSP